MHSLSSASSEVVDQIIGRLADLYDASEALAWCQAPQPLLNGQSPIELIEGGKTSEVIELVDRLMDGVHL